MGLQVLLLSVELASSSPLRTSPDGRVSLFLINEYCFAPSGVP